MYNNEPSISLFMECGNFMTEFKFVFFVIFFFFRSTNTSWVR